MSIFDPHTLRARSRLKVVLFHLWHVNYPSDSRCLFASLWGIFTQLNLRHNTITYNIPNNKNRPPLVPKWLNVTPSIIQTLYKWPNSLEQPNLTHHNICHTNLRDGLVRNRIFKGGVVQGVRYLRKFDRGHIDQGHMYSIPRTFDRGHIGRGRIDVAPIRMQGR